MPEPFDRDAFEYDRWKDPEFRERLARGNGYFDAWKGYAPAPDPFYEDAYMDGYEDFEEGW